MLANFLVVTVTNFLLLQKSTSHADVAELIMKLLLKRQVFCCGTLILDIFANFFIDSFAGHGKFHYWLLLVCGWANAADAVEILCVSFLLPSAECDLRMTSADKGLLSGMVFLGRSN